MLKSPAGGGEAGRSTESGGHERGRQCGGYERNRARGVADLKRSVVITRQQYKPRERMGAITIANAEHCEAGGGDSFAGAGQERVDWATWVNSRLQPVLAMPGRYGERADTADDGSQQHRGRRHGDAARIRAGQCANEMTHAKRRFQIPDVTKILAVPDLLKIYMRRQWRRSRRASKPAC